MGRRQCSLSGFIILLKLDLNQRKTRFPLEGGTETLSLGTAVISTFLPRDDALEEQIPGSALWLLGKALG